MKCQTPTKSFSEESLSHVSSDNGSGQLSTSEPSTKTLITKERLLENVEASNDLEKPATSERSRETSLLHNIQAYDDQPSTSRGSILEYIDNSDDSLKDLNYCLISENSDDDVENSYEEIRNVFFAQDNDHDETHNKNNDRGIQNKDEK
ncbi:uncharacterized protein LOC126742161 [Anthonomus grandis grandis]|uniref:uncharacterized protein LOC126742161 n=1 Tax=Anthonomus grandis grandis TaxID=2921223 RepID=UPI00216549B2|nr:uncharacterized protein LOC126742161 [Anthonomus grandis grandis]